MATESFNKRYDAWASAEAEVYKAMDETTSPEQLQALRAHADALLNELWGEDEKSLARQVEGDSGSQPA
ncbi:hypothetical protein ACHMXE_15490 [Variovorax sp. UC122_21]